MGETHCVVDDVSILGTQLLSVADTNNFDMRMALFDTSVIRILDTVPEDLLAAVQQSLMDGGLPSL